MGVRVGYFVLFLHGAFFGLRKTARLFTVRWIGQWTRLWIRWMAGSLVCWGLFITTVFASSKINGSRYISARGSALGGAPLAYSRDVPAALFYNPSDLSRIRGLVLEPVDVSAMANIDFLHHGASQFYRMTSLDSFVSVLAKNPGMRTSFGGGYSASLGLPGFAIGVAGQTQVSAKANGDGTLSYQSLYQWVPSIGTGARFLKGLLRVGYSLQWVQSARGGQTVNIYSGSLGYTQGLTQGSALAHQFGFSLVLPMKFSPTMDLVVRNAFGTRYRSKTWIRWTSNPTGVPATEPTTFDLGLSAHPRFGHGLTLHLMATGRDVTARSGVAPLGRLALGAELEWLRFLFIRAGWGGGYPSAGVGLRRPSAELAFAWYSEELGTQYLEQRDTRVSLQYKARIF